RRRHRRRAGAGAGLRRLLAGLPLVRGTGGVPAGGRDDRHRHERQRARLDHPGPTEGCRGDQGWAAGRSDPRPARQTAQCAQHVFHAAGAVLDVEQSLQLHLEPPAQLAGVDPDDVRGRRHPAILRDAARLEARAQPPSFAVRAGRRRRDRRRGRLAAPGRIGRCRQCDAARRQLPGSAASAGAAVLSLPRAASADEERAAGLSRRAQAACAGGLPAGRRDQGHADEQCNRHHGRRACPDRAVVPGRRTRTVKRAAMRKDNMSDAKLILDYVFDHNAAHPRKVFLTQPVGGGRVIDYTWDDVVDQARRMANHLRSRGFEPGARIAILSKNCAHFFMAELAIWMAGGTTVAIFPTETADTVRYVLNDSEASLLFVGKLDIWPQQASAVPTGLPCIAFPLAPPTPFETWDAIVARTGPLPGRPQRSPGDLAMLIYTSGSTGEPKGVMLTFEAVTRATEGIVNHSKALMPDVQEGRVLSYLPLAHSFERAWVEAAALVGGQLHVFFAESLDTFLQDLRRARPTVFISVPRLWLKFQQGVFAQMPPQKLDRLLRMPIIGRIVGRKVLKGLGLDQVRSA